MRVDKETQRRTMVKISLPSIKTSKAPMKHFVANMYDVGTNDYHVLVLQIIYTILLLWYWY